MKNSECKCGRKKNAHEIPEGFDEFPNYFFLEIVEVIPLELSWTFANALLSMELSQELKTNKKKKK